VRELSSDRLHLLPTFRWRLAPVSVRPRLCRLVDGGMFDVEYQACGRALPRSEGRQLAEQVARIISRPLGRSRPVWKLYVLDRLEADWATLLTKLHLAAVDGVSGAEVMSCCSATLRREVA
jgi:hypothetical protein